MDASSDLYNLIFWGVCALSAALLLLWPRFRRRAPKKKRRVERVAARSSSRPFRPFPESERKEPERLPEAGVLRPDTLVFRSGGTCALFVSRAFEAEAAEGVPVEVSPEALRRFSPLFSRAVLLQSAPEDEWSDSLYRVSFPPGWKRGFSAGEEFLIDAFSEGVRLGGPMKVEGGPAGGALFTEFFQFLEDHAPAHPLRKSLSPCCGALERFKGASEIWNGRLEELAELVEKAASSREAVFERSMELMAELQPNGSNGSDGTPGPLDEAEARTLFRRALALLGIMTGGDALCGMRLASLIVEDVESFPPAAAFFNPVTEEASLRHGTALSRLTAGLPELQARADRAVLYAGGRGRWAVRVDHEQLPEALLFFCP